MSALFALLPAGQELDALLGADQAFLAAAGHTTLRRYPRASDQQHAVSLVRDGGDRHATRWLRGFVLAMAGGAVLGAIVNGVLSLAFDLFSGQSAIAIPLGFGLGMFLGAFTAAMTGTHVPRSDLLPLLRQVRPGDVLLQWHAGDGAVLQTMRTRCELHDMRCVLLD
jgi:hypothetical protein